MKKRKEMPNLNYFVPHRSDLIETYVRSFECLFNICRKFVEYLFDICFIFVFAACNARGGGGLRQDSLPGEKTN